MPRLLTKGGAVLLLEKRVQSLIFVTIFGEQLFVHLLKMLQCLGLIVVERILFRDSESWLPLLQSRLVSFILDVDLRSHVSVVALPQGTSSHCPDCFWINWPCMLHQRLIQFMSIWKLVDNSVYIILLGLSGWPWCMRLIQHLHIQRDGGSIRLLILDHLRVHSLMSKRVIFVLTVQDKIQFQVFVSLVCKVSVSDYLHWWLLCALLHYVICSIKHGFVVDNDILVSKLPSKVSLDVTIVLLVALVSRDLHLCHVAIVEVSELVLDGCLSVGTTWG